jgi:hypothetical protein
MRENCLEEWMKWCSSSKKSHGENSSECIESKITLELPTNLLVMMPTKTLQQFEKMLVFGKHKYFYAGHINYNTGLLTNHFTTTSITKDGDFVEYSGKECKVIKEPNVSKSVLMLYTKQSTAMPTEDFVYRKTAINFVSYNPEERKRRHEKEYDSEKAKAAYDSEKAKAAYDLEKAKAAMIQKKQKRLMTLKKEKENTKENMIQKKQKQHITLKKQKQHITLKKQNITEHGLY